MKRIKIDLEMAEGADYNQPFVWKSGPTLSEVSPVDLTGWTAEMQIRAKPGDAQPLITLSTATATLIIADQLVNQGRYEISLSDESTQGICRAHSDIRASYDLFLIDLTGKRRAHQYGMMMIRAAINRPWEV